MQIVCFVSVILAFYKESKYTQPNPELIHTCKSYMHMHKQWMGG